MTRKIRLGCTNLRKAQTLLGVGGDQTLSVFETANIIAERCNWPSIEPDAQNKKFMAKDQVNRFFRLMETNTNFTPVAYVYFIQSGFNGPIKIGVAVDVDLRIKDLQTGNPHELKILAKIGFISKSEAFAMENKLHKKFHYLRKNGEWFNRQLISKMKNIEEIIDYHDGSLESATNERNKYKTAL